MINQTFKSVSGELDNNTPLEEVISSKLLLSVSKLLDYSDKFCEVFIIQQNHCL